MSTTSPIEDEVRRLRGSIRSLKIGLVILAALFLALLAAHLIASREAAELTVERINIVDPNGVHRVVIANAERFPLPRLNGKEYGRAVNPAGLVFYDNSGSELGGLAITDSMEKGRISALAFDYPNYDAIGLITRVDPDGTDGIAGLQINSRPPADLDVESAAKLVRRRIAIHNENENAEILLADSKGNDRIRLRVDAEDNARIEILGTDGKVLFAAPPESDEHLQEDKPATTQSADSAEGRH